MPEIGKLTDVAVNLNEAMAELTGELKAARDDSSWAKRVANVSVAVAVVAVIAAVLGVAYGHEARATANDVASARNEARVSACVQANVSTVGQRSAISGVFLVFAHPDANGALPEAEQAVFAEIEGRVATLLPFRDCTSEGIDLYYATPPADPALT